MKCKKVYIIIVFIILLGGMIYLYNYYIRTGKTEENLKYEQFVQHIGNKLEEDILSYYEFSDVNIDITYHSNEDIYTVVVTIITQDNQDFSDDDELFIKNAVVKSLEKISIDDVTINRVYSIDEES